MFYHSKHFTIDQYIIEMFLQVTLTPWSQNWKTVLATCVWFAIKLLCRKETWRSTFQVCTLGINPGSVPYVESTLKIWTPCRITWVCLTEVQNKVQFVFMFLFQTNTFKIITHVPAGGGSTTWLSSQGCLAGRTVWGCCKYLKLWKVHEACLAHAAWQGEKALKRIWSLPGREKSLASPANLPCRDSSCLLATQINSLIFGRQFFRCKYYSWFFNNITLT